MSVRILPTAPVHIPARDPDKRAQKVLLIGFEDQDNLGLRYLMSAVNASGHQALVMTYRADPGQILARIRRDTPDVVGFSLIFQYMAPDFGRVIAALRDAGVTAHFTMGGHYASFEPAEILTRIPGLDSIVRFEGEVTLVNLLNCLASGADWRGSPSVRRSMQSAWRGRRSWQCRLLYRPGLSASRTNLRDGVDLPVNAPSECETRNPGFLVRAPVTGHWSGDAPAVGRRGPMRARLPLSACCLPCRS